MAICQVPTQPLSCPFLNRAGGEYKMQNLMGQDEGKETIYQLTSWTKQAQIGEIMYFQLK